MLEFKNVAAWWSESWLINWPDELHGFLGWCGGGSCGKWISLNVDAVFERILLRIGVLVGIGFG